MELRLKAKPLDIETGEVLVALLDDSVAKQLDVFPADRLRITVPDRNCGYHNEMKGKCTCNSIVCVVDVAEHRSSEEVGLFRDVADLLKLKHGQRVIISPEKKPESIDLIKRKLEGETLNAEDFKQIVKDIRDNRILDTELSYFVSAAYMKGFSMQETYYLTKAMIETGEKLSWPAKVILDKHCVGGISGNRTTMVMVPIITAIGAMMPQIKQRHFLMPKTSSRSITSASVVYDTPVLISKNKKNNLIEIGKFADELFLDNQSHIKCTPGGEYIALDGKYQAPVFDDNYKIKKRNITGVFRHKVENKRIIELTLSTGRKVSITEDHSLFVLKEGEVVPIRADELQEESMVVVPKRINSETETSEINLLREFIEKLPDNLLENIFIEGIDKELFRDNLVNKGSRDHMRFYRNLISIKLLKNKKIQIPNDARIRLGDSKVRLPTKLRITKELIRLLGYYAAEGHCRNHSVEFYLGSHEKEFIEDLKHCINSVFGIEAKVNQRKTKLSETDIKIGTKIASLLFRNIFKLGNRSYEKRVPQLIFNVSNELKREYFNSYIRGDGNKRAGKYTGYEAVTTSRELITGMQYLATFIDLAYSTTTFNNIVREFENYTSYCAPAYHIYTQKEENFSRPSTSFINNIPIEEAVAGLLDEEININHECNNFKFRYNILNQKSISFENLKRNMLHLQSMNNLKVKNIFRIINGDLGFLKVKKIKNVNYNKKYVYDLCIKGYENFIGGYGAICLHNSGTADTMEVLANVNFSDVNKIKSIVEKVGGCIIWGGALDLAPADDKIIGVEHPLSLDPTPMLLASIMAKKASAGSTHVLIDVPVGRFSKITNNRRYEELKYKFVRLGEMLGIKVHVIATDGNGPIGRGFGPVLEARDVLYLLQNDYRAPVDLRNKGLYMSGLLLEMGGICKSGEGLKLATKVLDSGMAWQQMQKIISAQGGNPKIEPEDLKPARLTYEVKSKKSGKIVLLDDDLFSKLAKTAGAPKDKGAGVYLNKVRGEIVKKGEVLYTIYSESDYRLSEAAKISKSDGVILIK